MSKTEEQVFLEVKERLDYYRLPTSFPIEATKLLHKILCLLDKKGLSEKENFVKGKNSPSSALNDSLRFQIGKVIKENNRLHLELMNAQEQVQSLSHRIDKYVLERGNKTSEVERVIKLKEIREKELFEELTQTKYKYNELMDFIHEDPNFQKLYIKRLLKHKKLEVQEPQSKKESQFRQKKIIKQTKNDNDYEKLLLKDKIKNRQTQIYRLQRKIEYDGINMNKVLKDFENKEINQKIKKLESQISYLQDENKKMKKQVRYCRNNGGSKEALRQQMRKNHEQIKKLSTQNQDLQRRMRQLEFDCNAELIQARRQSQKVNQKAYNVKEDNQMARNTINDLEKKANFYLSELNAVKKSLQVEKQKNVKNQILIDQMKNTQEGGKILNQYELENMKQKLEENNQFVSLLQDKISKLTTENRYYKEEGILKSEAIENLEKIVDELMKKNQYQRDNMDAILHESSATNVESIIIMRKSLAEMKQILASSQSDKQKLEKDLANLSIRYENLLKDKKYLEEDLFRYKEKTTEIKNLENVIFENENQKERLKIQLKKQESLRSRIESYQKQADRQKNSLRRQLQDVNQEYHTYQKKVKTQINDLKMSLASLEEANSILQIRVKEKDEKILSYEGRILDLQSKYKTLTDQIVIIEDQKHNISREKHRLEKRYEDLQKVCQQNREKEIQLLSLNQNEHATQILWLKKEINKLEQLSQRQEERISELQNICDMLKREKDILTNDKLNFLKENDHLRLQISQLEKNLTAFEGRANQRGKWDF